MTVRVFSAGWVNGEIFSIGLTMALTAGSCARTLRYRLCASLSTISLGALIVMLLPSSDPVRMGIAALFALYLWSVYESSRHIVGQVEALLIAERELDIAARRDPLTGLANRRAFDEALTSVSPTGNFALLLLDLDGFKAVNDRLGRRRRRSAAPSGGTPEGRDAGESSLGETRRRRVRHPPPRC
jgi:predicted signal transduction protein with EAL and GGDEF domain